MKAQMRGSGVRACGVVLALCLLATGPHTASGAAAPKRVRPNVIVIVTDDQRRDTLSVMPKTRRWFRGSGVTYKSAWAPTPLCCPARASIFTGQYAHNHLVRNNDQGQVNNLEQRHTIQYLLGKAGYRTGLVGKYLNWWDLTQAPPYFDRFALSNSLKYYDAMWNLDGQLVTQRGYATHFLKRRVMDFIREAEKDDDDRPWFLYVATRSPHAPANPEPRYEKASVPRWAGNPAVFETDRTDKPPHVQAADGRFWRAKRHRRTQLRSLMSVDDFIEDLRLGLTRLGEKGSTLAFYVSDNGEQWAEHGVSGKGAAYTGSMKIPMLARWPGHLPVGKRSKRMVTLVDVAPTILDAANVTPSHVLDGRSLLNRSWRRDALLFEYWNQLRRSERPNWASVRTKKAQYTEYYDVEAKKIVFREHYDLRSDPWELENTLADFDTGNDAQVAGLSALLDRYRTCSGSGCP
ncbi:MAG: sulfatase [Actinomycetota bacterium]|nr:sulfatase [Actinomycetota bacterium]